MGVTDILRQLLLHFFLFSSIFLCVSGFVLYEYIKVSLEKQLIVIWNIMWAGKVSSKPYKSSLLLLPYLVHFHSYIMETGVFHARA